ncbi:unnamed protein product [Alternaria alternata]
MPTWLVHGFRWPRAQIRIHIILQNLDDAAPEWLMAPATTACMMQNFKEQWPEQMAQLPDLRFIEQYDPEDLTVKDQPYAYVCDIVHEIKLGVDVEEMRELGWEIDQWAAIAELRDKVAPGEKLDASAVSASSHRSSMAQSDTARTKEPERPSSSRSFKKSFGGKLRKTKSGRNLRGDTTPEEPVPPLPPISPRYALQSSHGKASAQK